MKLNKSIANCRVRRYLLIFTALSLLLLPLSLIYLVWNEQLQKIKGYEVINETGLSLIPDYAVQTLSEEEMQEMSVRMEVRLNRLKDKCSEYGLDVQGEDSWHTPNTWEFLVNKKYHIIWCNVFKAASSSWMFNFNVLAGYTPKYLLKTKKILLNLARERYPRVSLQELREAQNDSTTFIIARNPFERLLSAYRDKIVFALPYSFHDKLGRSIVRTYRQKPKLISRGGSTKYPSFPEFVHWLLDQIKRGNYIDMHFVSATSFCTPCLIRFDMILKFESLAEDQLYLIEKTGLQRVIAPVWRNMGKGGRKTEQLQQLFYSQLTTNEMMQLYKYYRFDFDLFGYDIKEYLQFARADESQGATASGA